MAGTIICDYIRTDANKLSLNVGNTTFATINAGGFYSNTGVQIISAAGTINATSIASGTIGTTQLASNLITEPKMGYAGVPIQFASSAYGDSFETTSTSFTTVASLSFTPKRTNSTLLVEFTAQFYKYNTTNGNSNPFRMMVNGTNIYNGSYMMYTYNGSTGVGMENMYAGTIRNLYTPGNLPLSAITISFDCHAGGQGRHYFYGGHRLTVTEITN